MLPTIQYILMPRLYRVYLFTMLGYVGINGNRRELFNVVGSTLILILLTWTIWRTPTNASKWRMGFNPYPANVDSMASSYQC